jgi:hypothetical protein
VKAKCLHKVLYCENLFYYYRGLLDDQDCVWRLTFSKVQHTRAAAINRQEVLQRMMAQNMATGSNINAPIDGIHLPPVHKYNSQNLNLPVHLQAIGHPISSQPQNVPAGNPLPSATYQSPFQTPNDFNRLASSYTGDPRLPAFMNLTNANTHMRQYQMQQMLLGPPHQKRSNPDRVEHDNCSSCWSNRKVQGYKCSHTPASHPRASPWQSTSSPALSHDDTPGLLAPYYNPASNLALRDYETQLMLLEQQNKKRLLMARQEQDNMLSPDLPSNSTIFTPELHTDRRAVASRSAFPIQHCTLQFPLLEQQNKERLLEARRKQDAKVRSQGIGSSLDPKTCLEPSTCKSFADGFSAFLLNSDDENENDVFNFDNSRPSSESNFNNDDSSDFTNFDSKSSSDEVDSGAPANIHPPSQRLSSSQKQMILLEQQKLKTPKKARQEQDVTMSDTGSNSDFSNKSPATAAVAPTSEPNTHDVLYPAQQLADFQMQLMLLEQQHKKRLMMARQEDGMMTHVINYFDPLNRSPTTFPAVPTFESNFHNIHRPSQPLSDSQMQLLLLEQQNKKRLMMARQEQKINNPAPSHDNITKLTAQADYNIPGDMGSESRALRDYKAQLALAEQQNKTRLMMARQEHDQDIEMSEPGSNSDLPIKNPTTTPMIPTSLSKAELDVVRKALGSPSEVLADYRKHLESLEQQGKTKLTVVGQEQDKMSSPDPKSCWPPVNSNPTRSSVASTSQPNLGVHEPRVLTDYQTYYMSPEQERLTLARQKHRQYMLAEQQNKRRLLLARQEQEHMLPPDLRAYQSPLYDTSIPPPWIDKSTSESKEFTEARDTLSDNQELSDQQRQLMMGNYYTHQILNKQDERKWSEKLRQAQKDMSTSSSHPESLRWQSSSLSSSPTSSSVVFTPESSASPQASEDEFNEGRPLPYRFAPQPPSGPF